MRVEKEDLRSMKKGSKMMEKIYGKCLKTLIHFSEKVD